MDMDTDTTIPQTAETAKIANRKESATVVWLTCRIRLYPNVMQSSSTTATTNPNPRPARNRAMRVL